MGNNGNLIFIVILVLMVALMWWQSRKSKQQQQQVKDFRQSLQPGELVQTIGGIIGKVVSVDTKYEEIVIDSEGSLMRFMFKAISRKYERPAYIDDEDVDEDGNPIKKDAEDSQESSEADDQAQKPFDNTDDAAQSTEDVVNADNDAQASETKIDSDTEEKADK